MKVTKTRIKTTLQIGKFDISISRHYRRELAYKGGSVNFFGLFVIGYDRPAKPKPHTFKRAQNFGTYGVLHLRKLITGQLQISVNEEGRQELIMMVAQHNDENNRRAALLQSGQTKTWIQPLRMRTFHALECDVLEVAIENGFDFVRPEEIGALTDTTLIGQIERDDYGKLIEVYGVWGDMQYAVRDWIEDLISTGEVIWDGGTD